MEDKLILISDIIFKILSYGILFVLLSYLFFRILKKAVSKINKNKKMIYMFLN